MKDAAGRVIYVGKAKNLRSRVSSYFQPGAQLVESRGPQIAKMIRSLVAGLDHLPCSSEVDALLRENRLIKDIQPRFNERMKDGKSFPFLQITTDEDFPRVAITRRPRQHGARLIGPFTSPSELRRALPLMQRVFKFRTCKLDISETDRQVKHFRPCLLHSIKQCSAPCAGLVSKKDYASQIRRLRFFLDSKGQKLRGELQREMMRASQQLQYERAAELRDELAALEGLQKRGLAGEARDLQPELFYVDPAEGLHRLAEVLSLPTVPRTIEGLDIAHLQGRESCGAVACFIDGKPLKSSYRRYKIKTAGNDDYASLAEVVRRRYRRACAKEELFPDIVLIDGGTGQLSAAGEAFAQLGCSPGALVSLSKKDELLHTPNRAEPVKLPRRDPALRLLQSVRDEAHRFAQHYHHILRRKATLDE
jgi:excinuclease ABC subunit C